MRLSFRKKTKPDPSFDSAEYTPVIRSSICTGEKVAGFRGADGRVHEVMLIRGDKDLDAFRAQYGITGDIATIY